MVVFVLCGLWHGANWTFLLWGIYHGMFLMIERVARFSDMAPERYAVIRRVVPLFIVTVGWVLFHFQMIFPGKRVSGDDVYTGKPPISYELSGMNYRTFFS